MVEILITASRIYTGREVLKEGYIYVRSGNIVAIGEGPPPQDLTFPTIVLGGKGRIVAPGLTLASDAAAYVARMLSPGIEKRLELYRALGDDAAFSSALPAVYELHTHGVTTVFVEYTRPSLPSRLADALGGRFGWVRVECNESVEEERPANIIGTVTLPCGNRPAWMLESQPVYKPSMIDNPWDASSELRRAAGLGDAVIKEGAVTEISIFNASNPPGMLLDRIELDLNKLYSLGLMVETLLSGEDILVDGGEHLYIVEKHFNDAYRIAGRIGL